MHSCIDVITLSSAYLTAQTFQPPSLHLSVCDPFIPISLLLKRYMFVCVLCLHLLHLHTFTDFHSGSILCVLGIQQLQFLDKHPVSRIILVVLTM